MNVQEVDRTKIINLRLNFKYTGAWKIIVSTITSMRSNNVSEGSSSEVEHYSNKAAYILLCSCSRQYGGCSSNFRNISKKMCLISRFHF